MSLEMDDVAADPVISSVATIPTPSPSSLESPPAEDGSSTDPVSQNANAKARPKRTILKRPAAKKPAKPEPDISLRSQKRKSLHPAALAALQAELRAEKEKAVETVAATGSPPNPPSPTSVQPVAASGPVPTESFSSPPQPIAKRLRTREVSSTPLPAPRARAVHAGNGSLAVRLADRVSGSPPADFEFTGSSTMLNHGNVSHQPKAGISSGPKSCLKSEAGASSKTLAFDPQLGDISEDSEHVPVPGSSAITVRPLSTASLEFDKKCDLKILSWNIASLATFVSKNTWRNINAYLPEIICLQETKVQSKELLEELGVHVGATHTYWHQSSVKGHAGVAILSKTKPLKVTYGIPREKAGAFADKGHVITAEYPTFFLVNAYVPNSSAKLKNLAERLLWDIDFRKFLKSLQIQKPVVVAGDLNCALNEIDIANPKSNVKNAGFTPEERASFRTTLEELELTDVFRQRNPDTKGAYTFWSARTNARARNVGWRLDYFLVSKPLLEGIVDIQHLGDVTGSDHCPIMLYMNVDGAPLNESKNP